MYSSICSGRPHVHRQELNNCSSSLWFYRRSVVVAVLLVVVGPGPRYCNVIQTRLSCNCILVLKQITLNMGHVSGRNMLVVITQSAL
jgi:hypothetical protein